MRVLVCCVLAACGTSSTKAMVDDNKPASTVVAKAAHSTSADPQERAREHAIAVDLPLIRKADRAVITWAAGGSATKTGDDLTKLADALTVTAQPPSGGVNTAVIAFYNGAELVRELWTFEDGEWGIKQSDATSWTLGRSAALAALIQAP